MYSEIKDVINFLENNGTILYPTDTVWGIGGDATNEAVVSAIYDIKQRPTNKSFIVLLPTAKDILQYVANPHPDIINIINSFKQPTTIIFDNVLGFPENILASDGSLAIRVVNDRFCKALLKQWKKPLISTSANLSGEPTPTTFQAITSEIKAAVDYIVKHRQDDIAEAQPSRIVKINDDGHIVVIRA